MIEPISAAAAQAIAHAMGQYGNEALMPTFDGGFRSPHMSTRPTFGGGIGISQGGLSTNLTRLFDGGYGNAHMSITPNYGGGVRVSQSGLSKNFAPSFDGGLRNPNTSISPNYGGGWNIRKF